MITLKFYRNDSSHDAHQPPVPLNLPTPIVTSNPTDYLVELASEKIGDPFDFTIKRRSNALLLYKNQYELLLKTTHFVSFPTGLTRH